ncbi:hypothetical protein ADUPG1_013792 [Aduncisulcus paluster]|uniref:EGF-like domain-containing protein n=1 Tax=Aduncisulcus paluster TaxID=2918883 RepID=A0ABQ5K8Y3_9EUKA|nr:hypothetical protein ADUPG1_013792 [Aduncisulcus paluster]
MSSAAVAVPLQKLSTTTVSYFLLLTVRVCLISCSCSSHTVLRVYEPFSYVAYTYVSNYLPNSARRRIKRLKGQKKASKSLFDSRDKPCEYSIRQLIKIQDIIKAEGIYSFDGIKYLISVSGLEFTDLKTQYCKEIGQLPQLTTLTLGVGRSPLQIRDFRILFSLNRLKEVSLYGHQLLFDISFLYQNIGIKKLSLSSEDMLNPICHAESSKDLEVYFKKVFPLLGSTSSLTTNSCSLPRKIDAKGKKTSSCSGEECPNLSLNEVISVFPAPEHKRCSYIAKEGPQGQCFTIHDDLIRSYLSRSCNIQKENNGILSVASLRTATKCNSLSLRSVTHSVSKIESLRGLEFMQGSNTGLVKLDLTGYKLKKRDFNVIQLLAKHVSPWNFESGLKILIAKDCGISNMSDVLDFTPIASKDNMTMPYRLEHLDLSDNNISDITDFLTSPLFLGDNKTQLAYLDLRNNNICDIDGLVPMFHGKFSSTGKKGKSLKFLHSGQTCHCSSPVSSARYQVCREVAPGRWAVECWKGYYYSEKESACLPAGYSTKKSKPKEEIEFERNMCRMCENTPHQLAVKKVSNDSIQCEYQSSWFKGSNGDAAMTTLHLPDINLRYYLCRSLGRDDACDIDEIDLATFDGFLNFAPNPYKFRDIVGLEYLTNIQGLNLSDHDIHSIRPLENLTQLVNIGLKNTDIDIGNLSALSAIHRLSQFSILGNTEMYDISTLYRNAGLKDLTLSGDDNALYTSLCHQESSGDVIEYLSDIFPLLCPSNSSSGCNPVYLTKNLCPLNNDYGQPCIGRSCPSIRQNEVYNPQSYSKECSVISHKRRGKCYTIHDPDIRHYLISHQCVEPEKNGVISVSELRSGFKCNSLLLSDITKDSNKAFPPLQGLEYIVGLKKLNLDGYYLGHSDLDQSVVYNKLVVQLLAKSMNLSMNPTGLTDLSLNSCNITQIEDVLDMSPIMSSDRITSPFILERLSLNHNKISDISTMLLSDLFPPGVLSYLDLSSNRICDVNGVRSLMRQRFGDQLELNLSHQKCMCPSSPLVTQHEVCREVYPDHWAVECWPGYFYDEQYGECVKASNDYESVQISICEKKERKYSIYPRGGSDIQCQCRQGWKHEKGSKEECSQQQCMDSQCPSNQECGYHADIRGFKCQCKANYFLSGEQCVYDQGRCSGCGKDGSHGSCGFAKGSTDPSTIKCQCNPNWHGAACTENCPVDAKGQVCNIRGFKCQCKANYFLSGEQCVYDQGRCSGCGKDGSHGSCGFAKGSTDPSTIKCQCNPNWHGAACTENCPVDAKGQVCSGRGSCKDGSCACADGFKGEKCELIHLPMTISKKDDFTDEGLAEVTGINFIDTGDSTLKLMIPFWKYLPNLRRIGFVDNEYIKTLKSFSPIASQITSLHISKSPIPIDDIYEYGFGNLKTLKLEDYFIPLSTLPMLETFQYLETLDVSSNEITDVSSFITHKPFEHLTSVHIADNYLCDIEGVIDSINSHYARVSSFVPLSLSDNQHQTCLCEEAISFKDNEMCVHAYHDHWVRECWNGYYMNTLNGKCETPLLSFTKNRVKACQDAPNTVAVLRAGRPSFCECREGWYGYDCLSECPIDNNSVLCGIEGICNTDTRECECPDFDSDNNKLRLDGRGFCVIDYGYSKDPVIISEVPIVTILDDPIVSSEDLTTISVEPPTNISVEPPIITMQQSNMSEDSSEQSPNYPNTWLQLFHEIFFSFDPQFRFRIILAIFKYQKMGTIAQTLQGEISHSFRALKKKKKVEYTLTCQEEDDESSYISEDSDDSRKPVQRANTSSLQTSERQEDDSSDDDASYVFGKKGEKESEGDSCISYCLEDVQAKTSLDIVRDFVALLYNYLILEKNHRFRYDQTGSKCILTVEDLKRIPTSRLSQDIDRFCVGMLMFSMFAGKAHSIDQKYFVADCEFQKFKTEDFFGGKLYHRLYRIEELPKMKELEKDLGRKLKKIYRSLIGRAENPLTFEEMIGILEKIKTNIDMR